MEGAKKGSWRCLRSDAVSFLFVPFLYHCIYFCVSRLS